MTFPKLNKKIITFCVTFVFAVSLGGVFVDSAHAAGLKSGPKYSYSYKLKSNKYFSANKIWGNLSGNKKVSLKGKKPSAALPQAKPQSSGQKNPPVNNSAAAVSLTAYEQEAVQLLNSARAAQGLAPLKVDPALVRLAENYAQDMINRKFFSHQNPEGLSPFDRMNNAGISYRWAGENLAINSTVSAAHNALMNSSGHRANILNSNFTHIGIGVKKDSRGSLYIVQAFVGR